LKTDVTDGFGDLFPVDLQFLGKEGDVVKGAVKNQGKIGLAGCLRRLLQMARFTPR
jgi:hypothetical protein